MIVGVILMRGNLSIIFGDNNDLYFHLKENVVISEIDKYTSGLIDSEDIRRDYQVKIQEFIKLHKDELKALGDRRGRIVITYQDLKNSDRVYRLRVLYQKNKNKMNMDYVLGKVIELLQKEKDPKLTADVIRGNLFLFETDFAKHRIKDAEDKILSAREKTYLNNILVNQIMKRTLDDLKVRSYDEAYFAVRKVDSFLERKKGYLTTPVLPTPKREIISKTSQVQEKDSNPSIRMKDLLLENQMYDREDIESQRVVFRSNDDVKPKKVQSGMLTSEEFMMKKLEEENGKRMSLSDIDLEYQEYVQDFKGNIYR